MAKQHELYYTSYGSQGRTLLGQNVLTSSTKGNRPMERNEKTSKAAAIAVILLVIAIAANFLAVKCDDAASTELL